MQKHLRKTVTFFHTTWKPCFGSTLGLFWSSGPKFLKEDSPNQKKKKKFRSKKNIFFCCNFMQKIRFFSSKNQTLSLYKSNELYTKNQKMFTGSSAKKSLNKWTNKWRVFHWILTSCIHKVTLSLLQILVFLLRLPWF